MLDKQLLLVVKEEFVTDTGLKLWSTSRWGVCLQLATAQLVRIKRSLLHLTDWVQDEEGLRS